MSIQNELTKLYKKLSEEGLNKEAQRLTPFIKESQFFTFLKPKHNQALRKINRAIRAGQADVAEAQLNTLSDLITDEQLMADLKRNLKQGDASGRRKFMKMLKAILKVLKAGGNVTLQTVKQEAETDSPAQETPAQETPAQETPAQAPEDSTETEESREIETTTELKAVPTSEENAIGDKKYLYFYNAEKKGFQVAKGSKGSVGAIIRAENKAAGKTEEYNKRLNQAYAIIFNMFKNQGYDMKEIPSPKAKAEYTGPASDVRYDAWTPESVGLDSSGFDPKTMEEISKVNYYKFKLLSGTGKGDLTDYSTSTTEPLIFIRVDDYNESRQRKIKDYWYGTDSNDDKVTDLIAPAEVTITPGTNPKDPDTYEWKKKE
jgi:hypothetical protein